MLLNLQALHFKELQNLCFVAKKKKGEVGSFS